MPPVTLFERLASRGIRLPTPGTTASVNQVQVAIGVPGKTANTQDVGAGIRLPTPGTTASVSYVKSAISLPSKTANTQDVGAGVRLPTPGTTASANHVKAAISVPGTTANMQDVGAAASMRVARTPVSSVKHVGATISVPGSAASAQDVGAAVGAPAASAPVTSGAVLKLNTSLNRMGRPSVGKKKSATAVIQQTTRKRKSKVLAHRSASAEKLQVPPRQIKLTRWLKGFLSEPCSPAPTRHEPSLAETLGRSSMPETLGRSSMPEGSPQLIGASGSTTCSICCDDIPASQAVRLRCQHGLYCLQCMGRHVEARLDLGHVQQTCPECSVELPERDLKRMLPQKLMDRLLARSLEQAVASEANLRPCPTANCPMRVALEPDDSGEFGCTVCGKDCCLRCGAQPYHKRQTCEQYAARMQKKSRRCSFAQWIKKTGSKQCPSCSMVVTKENLEAQGSQLSECHKMMCRNCGTCFCFKCLAILTKDFNCGCTKDDHGFVDPRTGKWVGHLKAKKTKKAKAAPKGKQRWQDRAGGA